MLRVSAGQPCVEISSPWQGRMTCSGKVTDANCTFSCNPGYDLVGSKFRTCLPSSRWSGNQTSCKGAYPSYILNRNELRTIFQFSGVPHEACIQFSEFLKVTYKLAVCTSTLKLLDELSCTATV